MQAGASAPAQLTRRATAIATIPRTAACSARCAGSNRGATIAACESRRRWEQQLYVGMLCLITGGWAELLWSTQRAHHCRRRLRRRQWAERSRGRCGRRGTGIPRRPRPLHCLLQHSTGSCKGAGLMQRCGRASCIVAAARHHPAHLRLRCPQCCLAPKPSRLHEQPRGWQARSCAADQQEAGAACSAETLASMPAPVPAPYRRRRLPRPLRCPPGRRPRHCHPRRRRHLCKWRRADGR